MNRNTQFYGGRQVGLYGRLMHGMFVVMFFMTVMVMNAKPYRRWIPETVIENTTRTWSVPEKYTSLNIEACIAMQGPTDGRGKDPCTWSLALTLADGSQRTMTVGWGNTDLGDFTDTRYLQVDGVAPDPIRFSTNVDVYNGDNTIIVDKDATGPARVYIGNDVMNYVGDIDLPLPVKAVSVSTGRKIQLAFMSIECERPVNLDSGLDVAGLQDACAPDKKSPLGLWRYFDRDNDAAYARPGGLYTIAVIEDPDNDGCYLLLYIDGARVNAGEWSPGMIKGRIVPTMFVGRYHLEWWDAGKQRIPDEGNAIVESDMLTLNFPLLRSQMRFTR